MDFSFRSLFGRRAKKQVTARPRARLMLENMEDRTVPSITFSGAGNTGAATLTGTAGNDRFVIRLNQNNPGTIEFSDNNGATFTSAQLSSITSITVNGLRGSDTLTIDSNNGLVAPTTGNLAITFNGGAGFDQLVLRGSPAGTLNETITEGSTVGSATVDVSKATGGAVTVNATGIEGITDTLAVATLTINATDQRNVLQILNGPSVNGQATTRIQNILPSPLSAFLGHEQDEDEDEDEDEVDDNNQGDDFLGLTNGAIVPINLANKTQVTLNLLGGDDFVFIANRTPAAGLTNFTIDGGAGSDLVANLAGPTGLTFSNVERVDTNIQDVFIDRIFEQLLEHAPTAEQLAFWRGILNGPFGRLGVAFFLRQFPEARIVNVRQLIHNLFGRETRGEEFALANFLINGGSEQNLLAALLAGPEFHGRAQRLHGRGDATERLLRSIFHVLLGRSVGQGELNNLRAVFQPNNPLSPVFVALFLQQLPELRTRFIQGLFSNLLHRDIDAATAALLASNPALTRDLLELLILTSEEFFQG